MPGLALVGARVFPRQREPTSSTSLAGLSCAPRKESAPRCAGEGPPAPLDVAIMEHVGFDGARKTHGPAQAAWGTQPLGLELMVPNIVTD